MISCFDQYDHHSDAKSNKIMVIFYSKSSLSSKPYQVRNTRFISFISEVNAHIQLDIEKYIGVKNA